MRFDHDEHPVKASRHHVRYAVLCIVLTVSMALIGFEWWLSKIERDSFEQHLETIAGIYSNVLADPVWNMDDERVMAILEALAADPYVRIARVEGLMDAHTDTPPDSKPNSQIPPVTRNILFVSDMATTDAGRFLLYGDESGIIARRANRLFIGGGVLAVLLTIALLLLRFFERAAEEELKFETISQMAPDAIVLCDEFGLIVHANQKTWELLGASAESALPATITDLIVNADRAHLKTLFASSGDELSLPVQLMALQMDGQELPVELTMRALPFRNSNHYIVVMRDISLRIEEAKKAQALQRQLYQSQKMEAVGTLSAGIAHDFNNILGSILGFTELSIAATDDPEITTYMQESRHAVDRARQLVAKLMTFSRSSQSQTRPLRILPLVEEALDMLRATIPATVDLERRLAGKRATVLADPTQLQQIVVNLCTNAMHAIGEAPGRITISLYTSGDPSSKVSCVDAETGRAEAILTVQDSGPGIDKEIQERIFEPFFTTKKIGQGTGLGLSVVHSIITELDGVVTLDSKPGCTKFTIKLPTIRAVDDIPRATPSQPSHGRGEILLVDDEPQLLRVVARMLEHLGYSVTTELQAETALEMVRTKPSRFSAVISDFAMPNMDGMTLANRIYDLSPRPPVILYTGYEGNRAIGESVSATLSKPVSTEDLAQALSSLIPSQ